MLTDNQAVTSKGIDPYLIIIYVALVIVGCQSIGVSVSASVLPMNNQD